MAVFVSSSTNKTQGSTSLTVSLPAGLVTGDLLIAAWASNNSSTALSSAPSGWTMLDNAPVAAGNLYAGVWYVFYTAGMVSPSWTIASSQKMAATVVAYRGVGSSSPLVVGMDGIRGGSTTDVTAPALTTTANSQTVLGIFMSREDSVSTFSNPTDMSLVDGILTTGGASVTSHVFSETYASAGPTGPKTVSYDVAGSGGYGILLAMNDAVAAPMTTFKGWGMPLILTPPPVVPATGTVYGVNTAGFNWSGGPNQIYTTRGSWFERIPCGRSWYNPGTFPTNGGNFNSGGTDWANSGGTYSEKRVNINFYFTETDQAHQVAIGTHDTVLINYINSIPSGWTVYLCYYTEYNLHLSSSLPASDFIAAFKHIGQLCATYAPDGRAVPTICISAFNWNNTNAPPASDMPANTMFLIDAYDSPNNNPSGYHNYGTQYHTPAYVIDSVYDDVVNGLGYVHWGIGEFNSPQRVAPALSTLNTTLGWGPLSPHDIDGSQRAAWITDFCNYLEARPVPPGVVLLWEGSNGSFNQLFTTAGFASSDDGTSDSPGPNYQGWPISIDKTPMVNAYKAFIDTSA